MAKDPCRICLKSVHRNHKAIQCDICDQWIHIKCNNLDNTNYNVLKNSTNPWFCATCTADAIPFQNLNNEQFFLNSKNISINSDTFSQLKLNTSENIQNLLNEFNNLTTNKTENDDDNPTINCQYYDIDTFCSSKLKSNKFFSILHINIASLSKHKEDLETLLKILNFEFSVLAITETRIIKNSIPNFKIDLDGYQIFHTPTLSPVQVGLCFTVCT